MYNGDVNFAENTPPMLGDGVCVVSRDNEEVAWPEAETPPPAALYGSPASPSRERGSSARARGSGTRLREISRQIFPHLPMSPVSSRAGVRSRRRLPQSPAPHGRLRGGALPRQVKAAKEEQGCAAAILVRPQRIHVLLVVCLACLRPRRAARRR